MSKRKLSDVIGQFATIPHSFIEQCKPLSPRARWLFVVLRYYTNSRTGDAFPTYDTLHELTGFTRQNIALAFRELLTADWVEKKRRFGKSTIYTLKIPISNPRLTNEHPAIDKPVETVISNPVKTITSKGGVHTNQIEPSRAKEQDRTLAASAAQIEDWRGDPEIDRRAEMLRDARYSSTVN